MTSLRQAVAILLENVAKTEAEEVGNPETLRQQLAQYWARYDREPAYRE